jgi:hypothetical protein
LDRFRRFSSIYRFPDIRCTSQAKLGDTQHLAIGFIDPTATFT